MNYSKFNKDELIQRLKELKSNSEKSIKTEEKKYKSLTNNLNVGIYRNTLGPRGRFIEANPAIVKMFGYKSKDEFLKINVSDLYPNPNDRTVFNKDIAKDGFVRNRELTFIRKDKSTFIGSVSAVLIRDDSKKPMYYDGIVEDITDRKAFEQTLKEREIQYRLLVENQTDLVVKIDTNGLFLFVSPSYCDYFNKSKKELLNTRDAPVIHEEDRESTIKAMQKLKLPPYNVYVEQRAMTKYGWRWIAWMYTAVVSDGKKVSEIVGVGRDITDRKIAEEALSRSEQSYRNLFDSTTDAIYIQDKEGRFLDVNQGAVNMYGYPRDYFVGKTPEFLSAPGKNNLKDAANRVELAFKGEAQRFEFWGIDSEKRIFPKEVRLSRGMYFGKEVVVAFAQDITNRRAAQRSLEEKEKKYHSIFNAFPDIFFKTTVKGIVKEISPSVEKITGFVPGEVIGKDSSIFYNSKKEWDFIGKKLMSANEVNDFDTQIKTKKNEIIHCSLTARIIFDDEKNPVEIEGVLRDITRRVNAETAVNESRRRLETLIGNLPGMAYRCKNDRNWTMEFISNGCLELTGYTPDEIISNKKIPYNKIIFSEDRKMVWEGVQKAVNEKIPFRLVYRIQRKNKQINWVWEQGSGIYNDNGKLIALEGFISDITEQVEAQEQLRKLSRSVEQSPTIVVITDLEAKIEYVNPRFFQVTGYTPREVIGKNPNILKSGLTPKKIYKELWKSITSGKDWIGEFRNKRKNGDLYWESANIFPLKDEKGNISHYIAMKEDITARKMMEQELINAKEKAEEADKLKSAFLANMSHEIRTPMNAIIGFSQLLNEPGVLKEERNRYISLIQNSGNDLLNLIDDIIDISKIEAGQMKVFRSQYFLDNLLTELYDSFKEILKTKPEKSNLKLKYNQTEGADKIFIYTDIDRFQQIFRNLLNNAIKFTDTGSVEFGFSSCKNIDKPYIQFYVKDTGIGIQEEKLDLIFQSFTQANESDTRLYGGTGLGLAITRKIVNILGGEIWVKSARGKGSTFSFTLPFHDVYESVDQRTASNKQEAVLNFDWKSKHILIVEDDEKSYSFYESILSRTNVTISRALDGIDALDLIKQNQFNLILMDIQLPRMNGYETTKEIKKDHPDLPVIAQTAYAMEDERERCLASGCDDYLSKPVKINYLLNTINKHIT